MRRRVALALAVALAADAATADILVAVPAPASGRYASAGDSVRRGVEQAVAIINQAGGLIGEHLTVVTADDGCAQLSGEQTARLLSAQKPALIVGHPCPSAAIAAASIYASAGVLFIAPNVRHPALTATRPSPLVFRLAGRDDRQGEAAAAWLLANAPNRRAAIVHDRTAYARTIAEATVKSLSERGLGAASVLTIVASKRDYSEIAARLKAEATEAVFFAGYPDEAAIILSGMRAAGIATSFLGSDSLTTADFASTAASGTSTIRALLAADPGASSEKRAEAAVEAWAAAVRKTSSTEAARIAASLRDGSVETQALGPISFDANGDVRGPSFTAARPVGETWTSDR